MKKILKNYIKNAKSDLACEFIRPKKTNSDEVVKVYEVCLNEVNAEKIGKSGIPVPQGFFKAILDMTPPYKMIAIYVPNRESGGEVIMTVDELENMTGYDFFDRLDDDLEKCLEKTADIRQWQ